MFPVNGLECIETARAVPDVQYVSEHFTAGHELTLGEMYLPKDKLLLSMQLLLEGNSIRSTARITEVDQNTIM